MSFFMTEGGFWFSNVSIIHDTLMMSRLAVLFAQNLLQIFFQ